jgi:zinc/manganese transport system ATP-binding protein/zinc transport system ATP-binding protein
MLHPLPHSSSHIDPIVSIEALTGGYNGESVLESIDLTISRGDFVGLVGPSGSGKTSLLKAILGTLDVYDGRVLVKGVDASVRRPRVGYVPQLETIDWDFPVTVEEVVMMGCTMNFPLFPWVTGSQRKSAAQMMENLGIYTLAKRHIRDLSGGQQQRIFLARALVGDQAILLLDEPTSGVDIKTRDDIMHLLHGLNHQGITVIMTTHEINSVAAHLPRVVCLNGRILADGPPSKVLTTEILTETYGGPMPVIHHNGMAIVVERPHRFGYHARKHEDLDSTGLEHQDIV